MLTFHGFRQLCLAVTEVFTRGDVFHFRGDNALTRIVQLGHVLACFSLAGWTLALHPPVGVTQILLTTDGEMRLGLSQFYSVITAHNPIFPQRWQAFVQIEIHTYIGVRARRVVYANGQVFFRGAIRLLGRRQGNVTLADGQIQGLLALGTSQIHVLFAGFLIAQTLQVGLRQR